MQISQITDTLESFAPIALQESFDNCGLLVGNPQWRQRVYCYVSML